jgi:hypothetical protein
MEGQRQGELKYPTSTLLRSSNNLGWSTLFAELRSHGSCEGSGAAGPDVEVAIAVRGSDDGLVTCKVAAGSRPVRPTTGTIWLNPIGAKSDEIRIASPNLQVIHLYVPTGPPGQHAAQRLSEWRRAHAEPKIASFSSRYAPGRLGHRLQARQHPLGLSQDRRGGGRESNAT